MEASSALRIWGLCHQLRLDEDDSKLTRSGRRKDRIEHVIRHRDELVKWYSQFTDRGQLTPKAKERVKAVKERADAEVKRIKSLGFSAPVLPTNDPYARGQRATQAQIDPTSGVALLFISLEDYLDRRPMQRALAWHVYVLGKTVRSFRYSEGMHTYCGSGTAAVRVHRNLKERISENIDQ